MSPKQIFSEKNSETGLGFSARAETFSIKLPLSALKMVAKYKALILGAHIQVEFNSVEICFSFLSSGGCYCIYFVVGKCVQQ